MMRVLLITLNVAVERVCIRPLPELSISKVTVWGAFLTGKRTIALCTIYCRISYSVLLYLRSLQVFSLIWFQMLILSLIFILMDNVFTTRKQGKLHLLLRNCCQWNCTESTKWFLISSTFYSSKQILSYAQNYHILLAYRTHSCYKYTVNTIVVYLARSYSAQ